MNFPASSLRVPARLRMRLRSALFMAAGVSLLSLTACLGTDEEKKNGPDLVIHVVDTAGAPLGADTVTWSYYGDGAMHHKRSAVAHGSDSTHKPAQRMDAAGTKWSVTDDGLHASVFLRASLHRAVDALCLDHGYVVKEIDADDLPQEVTLVLEVARVCE